MCTFTTCYQLHNHVLHTTSIYMTSSFTNERLCEVLQRILTVTNEYKRSSQVTEGVVRFAKKVA